MWRDDGLDVVTEYRAGTYIYFDRSLVENRTCDWSDCALTVLSTVVSRPTDKRAMIDAGSKSLTSDVVPASVGEGYGLILEYPEAVIRELSEEHGVVDFGACERAPRTGERLRIVPNHVCPVSNLVDEVHLHRDGRLLGTCRVAARGAH